MRTLVYLSLVVLVTPGCLAQVQPSATGGPVSLDDTQMLTPPPLRGGVYQADLGPESGRWNRLAGGIIVTGGYNDNILVGDQTQKRGDSNYLIVPTISIDRRTVRNQISLTYSSGLMVYQKNTDLNNIAQSGGGEYRYRMTRYADFGIRENFHQNSNFVNQTNPFGGGTTTPGVPNQQGSYVNPFASQITNTLEGDIHYQYGRNAMIGGTGSYSILHYSSPTNTVTLGNSELFDGTGFWSRRISRSSYIGFQYQHAHITTHRVETSTNTDTVMGTYTFYLTNTVSASILGGPQHYRSEDSASGVASESWAPAVQASAGYTRTRTSFVVGYSHTVTGAGGLIGAYRANTADLNFRRQLSRSWEVSVDGMYATFSNVTPQIALSNPGGHTISGTVSADHRLTERLRMGLGYTRFHQSYGVFGTGAKIYPDCNRIFASVSYQFSRLLGR